MAGMISKFIRGASFGAGQGYFEQHKADLLAARDRRLEELKQKYNVPNKQKTESFLITDPSTGERKIVTGSFDPRGGSLETLTSAVPGQIVSKTTGETPEEASKRKVEEAGSKKRAELNEELKTKPEIKKGEKIAEITAKEVGEAFDGLKNVRRQISNYNDALSALKAGAGTGAIEKYLPSFKSATIKLKNAQSRLGLDIVGDVTFGALSEGELGLALQTAVPEGLNEKELEQWIIEKRDAQEIYADYLENAAIFLAKSGNTIADWVEQNKGGQYGRVTESPEQSKKSGVAPTNKKYESMSIEEKIKFLEKKTGIK